MADIILFRPKVEIGVEKNINAFISLARDELTVFGKDLNFSDLAWDVTESVRHKGRGGKRSRITFSVLAPLQEKSSVGMSEPFLSFAKAYIRYMQGLRPTKNLYGRIAALRALEAALCEKGMAPSPSLVDSSILNRASQLIVNIFSDGAAYRIGGQLEMLADFLSNNRLTIIPLQWRNPIHRPKDSTRVGKDFDLRREQKMPTAAALDAISKIYQLASEPVDVVVSSLVAILCSAPDRINEVLQLPVDCEVYAKGKDGAVAYGLRWWPAKGAQPMVKWIVPSMAGVVKDAIAKIRKQTEDARCVAKWYEENPTKIYLPEHLEHLRNQELLTVSEVQEILFGDSAPCQSGNKWCARQNVPIFKQGLRNVVRFLDFEAVVLKLLPRGFPIFNVDNGLKYSEALFLVRVNELVLTKTTCRCQIESIAIDKINNELGGKVIVSGNSIFARFGFTEPNGAPIKVTTHQFRHYLNTLAQAGGMSQLDIAKWSGRKDIRQNAAYDHVSADELVLKIRNALGDDRQMFGPLAELPKRVVISRDEFARLKVPTAHITEFGVCIHDYTMAPCQLHADCINCNEQVCIKGDAIREARIRAELADATENLSVVRRAHGDGLFGASRWVAHYQLTVERLTQLCAILNDPKVPVGAVIQLSNLPVASRVEQAEEERAAILAHKDVGAVPSDASMTAMCNILAGMAE